MVSPRLAYGPQPEMPGEGFDDNRGNLLGLGFGIASIAGTGFIPTKSGRLWDKYLAGIRAVESGSPGGVLRTFRTSEFLSPLESWTGVTASAEDISRGVYGRYLRASFGEATGYDLRRTGQVFGEIRDSSGKVLGIGMQIQAGTQKGAGIADFVARIEGIQLSQFESLNDAILRNKWEASKSVLPYKDWLETIEPHLRQQRLIIGSKLRDKVRIAGRDIALTEEMSRGLAKLETTGKLLRAKAASTASRLNILLRAPVEFPGIKTIASKVPGLRSLSVKPGTSMQMLQRYVGKGLMVGAAWKGLEYVDYLRSQGSPWATVLATAGGAGIGALLARKPGMKFSKAGLVAGAAIGLYSGISPRFEHGLLYGFASMGADINVARAKASEAIGFTETNKAQEEITPGLMSLKTAVGFGGVGGLVAGLGTYAAFAGEAIKTRFKEKTPLANIFGKLREARATRLADVVWESGIGRQIAKLPGGKTISKIKSPVALGFLGGVAAWAGLAGGLALLSGHPTAPIAGILGTEETPEELQAIYSGEEEIPVRKGRWWEFGRCLIKSTTCKTLDQGEIEAEEIEIGDVLIGRDYEPAKVVAIYKREYNGEYLEFSSAFDRDVKTKVTPNHIIPVLDRATSSVYETEASNIRLNSYVEVPIKKLDSNRLFIDVLDIIKEPVFVDNNRVYAAQKNWYSGNLQKSGTYNIPTKINLNYDFGLLMGYFLAEGNISFNKNNPTIVETVHAKHEKDYVDDIVRISEEIFGITPTVRFKTTGKKTKEGCWIVRNCSAVVAKLFRWSFYPRQNYEKYHKQIPEWCLDATEDFKRGLIDGYYRGDGHWDSTKVISSSKKFILEKLQLIAFSIGELVSIGSKEENDYLGRWKARFVSNNATNPALVLVGDRLFAAIRSIETEKYDDLVYDFEVDHPDHLFVAGTFLVHNSTAFEGGRIDYYRPHMLARLKARAYQKGIYGTEEEKWEYDPWLHPIKALFGSDEWKYHYEQKYQYERPAPTTGTYGESVPFIGPLIAATFGKLFKPKKLVRPEEWALGGGEYVHRPDIRGETEPSYALGGLEPGAPVPRDEASQLLNELNYRRREAVGLVGFAEGALTKAAIGREEFFANQQTLGAMGEETGSEYWLWKHMNLGGGMGTTEAVRRFIPRTRSYLETYNPLRNALPSWMPEDYFLDLRYGNPFQKIPEAEIRLPGEGYAALHPEVAGVNPEEYPLSHKVKILGDVAMYSSEYRIALAQAKRNLNNMTQEEIDMIRDTERQVRERKKRRGFQENVFTGDQLETFPVTVTGVISPRRITTEEFGEMAIDIQGIGTIKDTTKAREFAEATLLGRQIELQAPALESRRYRMSSTGPVMRAVPMVSGTDYGTLLAEEGLAAPAELEDEFKRIRFSANERLAGRLGEFVTHGIESPIEYLTPVSPASKLIRQRTAVEEYAATEAIGTGSSFWDRPIENFLKPAMSMAAYKAGITSTPSAIQERRDIQEYFDMLKWVKYSRLESKARQYGDLQAAADYRKSKEQTVFGVDVFKSPVGIMQALPRRERDFFGEFVNAQTEQERAEILSLIPQNEKRIYVSQWMRQEEAAAYAKRAAKMSDEQDERAITITSLMRKSEGFTYTPSQENQWLDETGGQIEFDEYIREKKAAEYFSTHSLPGADWLGWHPSVDLEDVKLQYVEQAGLDHHDFDLWGQRKRALARKPYINPSLIGEMDEAAQYDTSWKVAANSRALSNMYDQHRSEVYITKTDIDRDDKYNIQLSDGRRGLIEKAYRQFGA